MVVSKVEAGEADKYQSVSANRPVYVVREMGDDFPSAFCPKEFDSHGFIWCDGFGSIFRMNKKTLRFSSFYLLGYTVSDLSRDRGNTPSVTIGECSPF